MSGQRITFSASDLQGAPETFKAGDVAPQTFPAMQPYTMARPEDFTDKGPEGSAVGRFLSNAGEVLNPLALAKGLYGAVRHPVDTVHTIVDAQAGQGQTALDMAHQGRYSEAIGHGIAAAVPLLGPAAAQAGEQIGSGDIAGGLGRTAGLLAPAAAPTALRAAARNLPARAATALETGANERIADVMSPKVGANKVRFGNQAEKVAPAIAKDLANDGAPMTREGLHGQVSGKLAEAEQALDAAASARNPNQVVHTTPILRDLKAKRAELTAQTHSLGGMKAGQSVVPGPNAARVASIDQAIEEISSLGPVANYEALRRVRAAYDQPAKVKYSPSMTADYLKAQGGASGAADVTGVLRDHLAKMDPATAAANADYHIYRTANDVLEATREIERTRPKMGRMIMARLTTTLAGQQAAGVPGAIAGYVGGPLLDSLLSSGGTTKLKTAAMMTRLATAIRSGNTGAVDSLLDSLKRLAAQGAALSTSPSGSQRQTTAPASGQLP